MPGTAVLTSVKRRRHPGSAVLPQRPGASGSTLRCNAICIVSAVSEVWGSLGMAWSHAAACGPAWERKSARRTVGWRQGRQQHVKVPCARLPPMPPFTGLGDPFGPAQVACDFREEGDVLSAGHASFFAVAPKQACRVPHTAASCAGVNGARRSGGTVRSAWLTRGAAQKLRGALAQIRSIPLEVVRLDQSTWVDVQVVVMLGRNSWKESLGSKPTLAMSSDNRVTYVIMHI